MRGKLLLFGDHAVVYGRPCLAAAINRYVTVTPVEKIGQETKFVAATRKLFEKKYGRVEFGFNIKAFDSRYGLGSSAAVTAAVAQAMFKLKKIKVSKKELFDFCYQVVKRVQGVGSGFDVAAAIYGGVIYFVGAGKKIVRLPVNQLPLVVGYSGRKAETVAMVRLAAAKITPQFLAWSEAIVNQARLALERQNWPAAGRLMTHNQAILAKLGVSTPKLDQMIRAAAGAGAYGAKLSGAGGGDCMIVLVDKKKTAAVKKAIEAAGGEVIRVRLAL
jgi:mevalonate kinase